MATATKKKTSRAKSKSSKAKKSSKAAKKTSKKDLKPDHPDVIKEKEKEIYSKYGPNGSKAKRKLVRGSTRWNKKRNKYEIEIVCAHPGCKEHRYVATSDLFQVDMCEEHTKERRNKARAEKRKKNAKKKSSKK